MYSCFLIITLEKNLENILQKIILHIELQHNEMKIPLCKKGINVGIQELLRK